MKVIKIFLLKLLKLFFILPNKKKYFQTNNNTDYLILKNLYELKKIKKNDLINFRKK